MCSGSAGCTLRAAAWPRRLRERSSGCSSMHELRSQLHVLAQPHAASAQAAAESMQAAAERSASKIGIFMTNFGHLPRKTRQNRRENFLKGLPFCAPIFQGKIRVRPWSRVSPVQPTRRARRHRTPPPAAMGTMTWGATGPEMGPGGQEGPSAHLCRYRTPGVELPSMPGASCRRGPLFRPV